MTAQGSISPDDYQAFQSFLEQASGIVLGANKEYLVASRLNALLHRHRFSGLPELLARLRRGDSGLRTAVVDAMTTNETFWFRDISHFRLLSERVLPEAVSGGQRTLRIWSAACSSGQEPYSISMTAQDFIGRRNGRWPGDVEIVATDLSTRVLAEARAGVYCGMAVSRGLEADQRRRHFLPKGDCLEVRPELRRRVRFQAMNLTGSYNRLGRFDVIFCRNVLIYFSARLKADILDRMAHILKPGGYLFLGSTESLSGHSQRFDMISAHGGIVYRLKS